MKKLIVMTKPTKSAYYVQGDQIQHKQIEMIRRRRANKLIRAS